MLPAHQIASALMHGKPVLFCFDLSLPHGRNHQCPPFITLLPALHAQPYALQFNKKGQTFDWNNNPDNTNNPDFFAAATLFRNADNTWWGRGEGG
jgi:hypothetical protein